MKEGEVHEKGPLVPENSSFSGHLSNCTIRVAWNVAALERSDNVVNQGHAFAVLKRGYIGRRKRSGWSHRYEPILSDFYKRKRR